MDVYEELKVFVKIKKKVFFLFFCFFFFFGGGVGSGGRVGGSGWGVRVDVDRAVSNYSKNTSKSKSLKGDNSKKIK